VRNLGSNAPLPYFNIGITNKTVGTVSNENGIPTDLMVQKNIVFDIKDNFLGWFTVDLEPYHIYLKEEVEEIALTIQWLESVKAEMKSKYFAISTASSPTHTAYFREKAMDSWTKGGQNLSFYLNAMCE
jgi:hypothetical protein